ncbi:MAG: hypothetical protein AAFY28_16600 [Actinomycetota bacterium]
MDLDAIPNELDPSTERFLARLSAEQAAFIRAVDAARVELNDGHLPMAVCAASHARLTREFLDAQRGLLRRRGEATHAAATIARQAMEDEAIVVSDGHDAVQRIRVAAGLQRLVRSCELPAPTTDLRVLPPPTAAPHPPGDCDAVDHAGGQSVGVSESHEGETIDRLLEFGASHQDPAHIELRVVLDEWWSRELADTAASIEAARAAAAVRLHDARRAAARGVERAEIESGHRAPAPPPGPLLPVPVRQALEDLQPDRLDRALDDMIGSLQLPGSEMPAARSWPAPNSETARDAPTSGTPIHIKVDDQGHEDFWVRPESHASARAGASIWYRIGVPAGAAASAVVAAFALLR